MIETDVSSDFAQEIAEYMESLYVAYTKYTRGQPKFTTKSSVIVFKKQADFISRVEGVGKNTAGCYAPSTKALVTFLEKQGEDGVKEVLRHEGFHQFFDKWIGQSPAIWINEGLAGYFERSIKEGNDFIYGIITKQDVALVQQALKGDKLSFISPRELMLMDVGSWNRNVEQRYDKARLQYLEARLLVQFLLSKKDYTRMLDNYLKACERGADLEEGLRLAFGNKLAPVTKAWLDYMKQLQPNMPQCCTFNLQYISALLQMFSKYHKDIPSPAALLEIVRKNKDITWYVREIGGGSDDKFTQKDIAVVEKWFVCPNSKNKDMACTYEFVKSDEKLGYPDILCRNHAPFALRAVIVPGEEPGKTRTIVREEPVKNSGKKN